MISRAKLALPVTLLAGLLLFQPAAVAGQQRTQSPTGGSQAEILRRLKDSGITRAEARQRMMQLGLDPAIVDRYFDVMEGRATLPHDSPEAALLRNLEYLALPPAQDTVQADSARPRGPGQRQLQPTDTARADTARPLPVFGRALFDRATSEFQPLDYGPVPPDYRLGAGDELVLILTGDLELSHALEVTREGYVIIPDVGQVYVSGLTMKELESRLYSRLGRVYSGVRPGPEATTHFQISLGAVRRTQVFVIGDVQRPGAYQLSATSRVLNALYQAGGPSDQGSFRHVEIRRGGEVVGTIDLYRYLLHGDNSADVRIEQGDVIFVPLTGSRVAVKGAVRRPAIYELVPGETLDDALFFAGGLKASAVVRRAQIDRVLPPLQRRPGLDRAVIDVDLREVLASGERTFELKDGDTVTIFDVSDERKNLLTITGRVEREGTYEWADGMTLWQLIDRADGLDEAAFTPRAHIFRLRTADGSRELIRTPLLVDEQGRPVEDVRLAARDSVVIYSGEDLRQPASVYVDGFVKQPGSYTLARGMTVADLILAAGGFVHGADSTVAEVARETDAARPGSPVAEVYRVQIGTRGQGQAGDNGTNGAARRAGGSGLSSLPTPDEFELRHEDRVYVRQDPGYVPLRTVVVAGQVVAPGTYVLRERRTRLTDVIERAGGVTSEAYIPGTQLTRRGELVATDLPAALDDPDGPENYVLQEGDTLYVPQYDFTVRVSGAVAFETRVPYKAGASLGYYIDQAGGYGEFADRNGVSITYQNGRRAVVDRMLLFRRQPKPRPGSAIAVPQIPENQRGGPEIGSILANTISGLTALALLMSVLDRVQ